MTVQNLLKLAKAAAPDLKRMSEDKAKNLLREVLRIISGRIVSTEAEVVSVEGFGSFLMLETESEQQGEEMIDKRIF